MSKIFNTTGPCNPDEHYMLPAQARCRDLLKLIEQKHYFVIHAARQSGKTTLLLDLAKQLNDSGDCHALYCSLESVQKVDDAEKGIPAVIRELSSQILFHPALGELPFADKTSESDFNVLLRVALSRFCQKLDKPLVILFDEVDCLANGTLISFLRQLRTGYVNRSQIPFVHSVALVGMRNIRDYKARVLGDQKTLGSASPFNIVKVSATLRNFTEAEVAQLYAQHTETSGQIFPPEAVHEAWRHTQGQPWLVNAVGDEITERIAGADKAILPE
ncbi:MAG: ATP-binding protein, partial [Gammaproteobacteria bacterium]|nr:ATP-binding protein [Gammaproteobacteria bacterium]